MAKPTTNIVQGPQGFSMPEAIAMRIESLAKGLPKDFTYRRVGMPAAKSPELIASSREEVSYITTDAVDREGDVVLPTGCVVKDYSGVVTWCHTYGPQDGWVGLPVGRSLWIKPYADGEKSGLVSRTKYTTRPPEWTGDWLPDAIVHFQSQDPPELGDKSVGFLPLNVRSATSEEKSMRPEWKGAPIVDKWALLEYAVCPLAVNQEAAMLAMKSVTPAMIEAKMRSGAKSIGDLLDLLVRGNEPIRLTTTYIDKSGAFDHAVTRDGISSFVRPATIKAAVARQVEAKRIELLKQIDKRVADAIIDRMHEMLGTP